MSSSSFFQKILHRLQRKLLEVIPVVIAAVVFTLLLWVLVYIIVPFLPQEYQNILEMVRSSDVRTNIDRLDQLFEENEAFSPYIFLALQILQILFAPIPGQLVGFAGGYFFGFWHGLLLTIIGLGIGSWLAMGAGRLLGNHFVQRFVPQKVITRFDYLTDQGGLGNFFILFLLPAIPDDALCFIAGLTRLSIGKLMLVCILGRMPGMMVLLSAGASIDENRLVTTVLLVIFTVISLIVWLYKEETVNFLYRLLKRDAPTEH